MKWINEPPLDNPTPTPRDGCGLHICPAVGDGACMINACLSRYCLIRLG